MHIATYMEHTVDSELSGNAIDLCPVGALTDKPYRYSARPWELQAHDSVSPHDCVGANIRIDSRSGKAMRVVARDNESVNECWIADRDRFSYTSLAHEERLTKPQINDLLNTLPVDITFVDADDTVRYFNKPEDRIFVRTKAVLGRKVQNCHPQKSLHIVSKIVEAFKNGEKINN